ncbi:Levodione reductase [Rhodobacteraceae bacterium THAF1]|uniref:SDR family NAD(P)-dependent oxidoreductase n=1 Tax=Palleronia sp. THAF1 TaxID=2587842 RepID=UPI000F3FE6BA|nr:SDR family oxidoreductase [Palleronia sp. THAF1]QFU07566.1 Levodione reductase [Palleronia sp. THAF1]VDC22881.1 Levodione reductase [Rhodobacteraceae bacterium THAF1]
MAEFQGLSVLLTGAASGFGAGAARAFAERGARLVLADVAEAPLRELADALGATAIVTDVSDADQVAAMVAKSGRIDIAINNAGIGGRMAAIEDTTAEEFDRLMAVNARGVFLGMKYQIATMRGQGGGVILNVASAAGLVGAGHLAAYAASKHAVVGLTRAAADEVARHGIRVNALCPSFASTPLFDAMADQVAGAHGLDRDAAYGRIASRVPMRRVATVDEIVEAMLWLCSPANTFMTGQAVALDGGLTAI